MELGNDINKTSTTHEDVRVKQCDGQWFHKENFQPRHIIQNYINFCPSPLRKDIDKLKFKLIQATMIDWIYVPETEFKDPDIELWSTKLVQSLHILYTFYCWSEIYT